MCHDQAERREAAADAARAAAVKAARSAAEQELSKSAQAAQAGMAQALDEVHELKAYTTTLTVHLADTAAALLWHLHSEVILMQLDLQEAHDKTKGQLEAIQAAHSELQAKLAQQKQSVASELQQLRVRPHKQPSSCLLLSES